MTMNTGRLARFARVAGLAACGAVLAGCAAPDTGGDRAGGGRTDPPLPTGRWLEPDFAAVSQGVGSLPVNLLASPDGKYVVATDAGNRESLWSVATADGKGVSHVDYKGGALNPSNGLYYGLAFAPDGTLYAAQGNAGKVAVLKLGGDGKLTPLRTIATGKGSFPAGLALDGRGVLYVTDNDPTARLAVDLPPSSRPSPTQPAVQPPHAAFGIPGSVGLYDAAGGGERGRFFFDSEAGTSSFPLAVAALSDGSKIYVASERDAAVYVLDVKDPAAIKQLAVLATGSHPDALLLDKAQSHLFVANAHSDTISVVETAKDQVISTVLLRPEIAKDLAGATPTGLALSPDEKTLYAALADMNAVAVIDVADPAKAALTGYIPAGWYPTALAAAPDGKRLLVANAKGNAARVPHDFPRGSIEHSPLRIFEGTVSAINLPAKDQIGEQTNRVLENARLTLRYFRQENPLKGISLRSEKPEKIRHVIYVVKENRTYDQVLGDLPQGNGDPNRCIFGRDVTPNLHALAERFVLLDNFYDSGEVSGDGWTWTTQAQANEYVQRNVPYQYSDRGRRFDYEGAVNSYPTGGFPAAGPDGKPLSDDSRFKAGAKPIRDVAEAPGGHLWDSVRKAGLSYRNYGFFVGGGVRNDKGVVIPDNWPSVAGLQPGGHDLEGVTDVDFRHFDLDYPDSDAPRAYADKTKDNRFLRARHVFGRTDAPSRFTEWEREFQMMLKKDPAGGAVPAFMTVRFGTDHTQGTNPGKPTPRSMVADNDYAVAQLVQAVSNSPVWKSTAIFVIEDDAQNGPDHVDAHRSTCYVVSPWVKKGSVDHTFQNTVSVIKTMELLLDLPPMCQFDAASGAIGDWDAAPANDAPYAAILPDENLIGETNPLIGKALPVSPELPKPSEKPGARRDDKGDAALAEMADQSAAMDFTHADRAPAELLNRIIWKSVKGTASEMPPTPAGPAPVVPGGIRGGGKAARPERDKDDDDD